MEESLKTGTTTVGIVCKDALILAADKRATAGHFIADKKVKKVIPINNKIAITTAGTVSDIQLLVKLLKAELKLKEIRTGRENTLKEVANLLAGYMYGNIRNFSVIPGITHFILAGADTDLHLFDLYPDGAVSEIDDFVSSGSGSVFVYGVLESEYKPGLTEQEGVELAIKCINTAMQRDSASGNGINVVVITKDGVREVLEKIVETKL
ncbi:proteasome subunit beta [Candidatus Woesearchaeota archaeon]|nr:proteasome subunit beta [Candidatus Woesearchaeota archaeon]